MHMFKAWRLKFHRLNKAKKKRNDKVNTQRCNKKIVKIVLVCLTTTPVSVQIYAGL